MGDGALLLGVGLGREDDVGVALATDSVRNCSCATTNAARRAPRPRARRPGSSRTGSQCSRKNAFTSPDTAASRAWAAVRPPGASASPGPSPGRQPTSRRPRPLVPAGISIMPEPGAASRPSSSARSSSARPRPGPRSPGRAALPRPRSRCRPVRRRGHVEQVLRVDARRCSARRSSWLLPGTRPGQGWPGSASFLVARAPFCAAAARDFDAAPSEGPQQRLGSTRGEAQHLGGAAVERRGGARRDHQARAEAAHGLAQPQVQDRRLLERVGLQHQHGRGAVDVGDGGAEVGMR